VARTSELVDLHLQKRWETDKAVLVTNGEIVDGKLHTVWLPKSQIEIEPTDELGVQLIITLPRWLAEDKGLV
jgi:hypothetical protein